MTLLLMELVFDGKTRLGPDDFPRPINLLDKVALTTLVTPHPAPEIIDPARTALRVPPMAAGDDLIPDIALGAQHAVMVQMNQYERGEPGDRMYVLEFQGPRQYIKFGHTRQLSRRVQHHATNANWHGYGLVQGWASPPLLDAKKVERVVLNVGHMFFPRRCSERFPDTPYESALQFLRVVVEQYQLITV